MKNLLVRKLPTVSFKASGSSGQCYPRTGKLALFVSLILVGQALPVCAQQSPGAGGGTPVAPDLSSEEARVAYKAARTPQAIVALVEAPAARSSKTGALPGTASATPPLAAPAPLTTTGGVLPSVKLVASAVATPAKGASPGTAASVGTNPAAPPAASVTLQFDPARAGQVVWVQTLDGGQLSALDADGGTVQAEGGFDMEISAGGTVVFTYQAPAIGGHYQVVARLDNVSTILPFDVPDIELAN